MQVAKDGFIRWFFWAYFSWRGEMKRLPYALGYFAFMLLVPVYTSVAAQWLAVNVVPPPGGGAPDPAYAISLTATTYILPFLLPICFISIALDLKRLRSIGGPLALAFAFSLATVLAPIYAPGLLEMISLTSFAYRAILAVIPAKEDRLSPLERKARTWERLATGTGSPRRLSGKQITEWRIVRQGRAQTEGGAAGKAKKGK